MSSTLCTPSPVAPPQAPTRPLPDQLRQVVWRAHGHAHQPPQAVSSGHEVLDAVLPGQGWPCRTLTEIVLPQPGQAEWQLLAPALRQVTSPHAPVLLLNAPHEPGLQGLQHLGLDTCQIIQVVAQSAHEGLWALEQALKADCFGSVLAWLPGVTPTVMRRLQSLAGRHSGLLFVFRELAAQTQASAAPLRLRLGLGPCPHPLVVDVFKRRGCPAAHTVQIEAWPAVLRPFLEGVPSPEVAKERPAWAQAQAPIVHLAPKSHVALDRPVAQPVEH
ncbi:MAG: translesion DNA synthesis-associated protein ImuA [Aquabacterium sp.]